MICKAYQGGKCMDTDRPHHQANFFIIISWSEGHYTIEQSFQNFHFRCYSELKKRIHKAFKNCLKEARGSLGIKKIPICICIFVLMARIKRAHHIKYRFPLASTPHTIECCLAIT